MFFVSDNTAGVHPEVLAAIAAVNGGVAPAYGRDRITARAEGVVRRHFGEAARVVFVTTGTAANVVALAAMLRPHETALVAESSHVWLDEGGGVERFTGSRLTPVPAVGGKIDAAQVRQFAAGGDPLHSPRARVVSVAQPTEFGTVYTQREMAALAGTAHDHGLLLHVDGARLANAAVALGTGLAEAAAGADVVSLGGTKNGALAADAVVFLDSAVSEVRGVVQKQAMQLVSKSRFVAAQFLALLDGELWRTNAAHANAMAARVAGVLAGRPGAELLHPVQTNAVFASLRGYAPPWEPRMRFMTAFDTTEADLDAFAAALAPAQLPET